jgi:cardiolipin synthase (CMP-forming)
MKAPGENIYTIPNFLSAYRLVAFPFILWMVLSGRENLFVGFLIANLITDVLDGFIARRFKMQTQLGARLDSIADTGTYILAFLGIIFFQREFLKEHWPGLSLFVALYFISWLVTMLKFGRICGLHLYVFKATGYLQGIFFALLFTGTAPDWYYYLMISVGCWANIEEIIIFILLKEPRSNVKGLYWVLKTRKVKIENPGA